MKKLIFTLIALLTTLLSLSFVTKASTLDSIDIYLKYQNLDQAIVTEQIAPTSITDAGEERINNFSGAVSYYSEEINLPGKNGFDLVIGRKFNSAEDKDINGTSHYVTVSGYRNLEFPDVEKVEGIKYIFPYYVNADLSGEPVYVAFRTISDMLIAEDNTAAIIVEADYETDTDTLRETLDLYYWGIIQDYDIGFTFDSEYISYNSNITEGVTLYRDTAAGYTRVSSSIEQSYYYIEGAHNPHPASLGGGWEYALPFVTVWDVGRDEEANTDCRYGMFYDPQTKMNVNFRFRYDGTAFLDACCNTDMEFYEVPYNELNFYCIKVEEYSNHSFTYYIRRYDGVKFFFVDDVFQYMEDRYGNKIEYLYSETDDTVTIIDSLGREILLSKSGITVNGVEMVKYSFSTENNSTEDPLDLLIEDNTGVFTAAYRTLNNTFGKTVTYNMSQRDKKVYCFYEGSENDSQAVLYPKALIDDITVSTGAKRYYLYDEVLRYTYTNVQDEDYNEYPVFHAYKDLGCVERYDTQPDSAVLENYQKYTYSNPTKGTPTTKIEFSGRDDYKITETYDVFMNLKKRVTSCTDLDYTLTEEYTYITQNRVPLVSRKEVTKKISDGSNLNYVEVYDYSNINNQLTKISRDNTTIYEATYTINGLLETEYSIYGEDEYRGVNTTISNGNITEKTYVTKASRSATPVAQESVSYTYDSFGNLASIDGDGVYVEYTYEYGDYSDGATPNYSIIITETYPEVDNITNSQGVAIPSANIVRTSYYDKWGNLVKTVDGEGNITTCTYDYLGRVLKITNPDNTTKQYSYNDTTNRISITNELGKRFNIRYDSLGREFAQYYLSEDGTMWKLLYHNNYDTYGNLTRHTLYYGGGVDCIYNYSYYSDNSLKTEILKQGLNVSVISQNTYTYTIPDSDLLATTITRKKNATEDIIFTNYTNQYGYKVKDTISDGAEEVEQVYTTDVAGNILKVKDLRGYIAHTYTYDYRGRVLTDTYPIGKTTNIYDGAYLYQVKDSLNNVVKTYEYNTQGQLITETTPIDDDTDNLTNYYYDRNGNLTKTVTTTADGTTTKSATTHYDNRNRPVAVNDGSGYYTRYEYNNIGNITRMATGVPTVTEELDRNTHSVTDYEYSYRDFLSKVTDPMGYTESYTYNIRGTMLTATDKNGTLFEYTYNGAPWLLSKTATGTNNTEQTISYTYDYLGNITQMVDENGSTLYTYDRLGNILTETRGTLVKEYAYDNNGNRKSALITDGTFSQSLTYSYDNNNRLTRISGENGYTSYTYDKNNRILTEKTCNTGGVSLAYSKYEYYDSGLLSTKKNYTYTVTSPTYLVDEYAITYYADGNIATVDNNDSVTSYVYDSAGRLSNESIDGTLQASYTYDSRGNRATMTNPTGTTAYTYNKNNHLTAENTVAVDGTTSYNYYSHDSNGNLREKYWGVGLAMYDYDLFGRLTRYSSEGTSATYTYDGNGIRTSKTVGGVTTNFINDGAYVVGEVSGDSIIKYTYGLHLISINNNGTLGYYHTDEHGSVSAISDKSRNIVADYDFDAFGNETVSIAAYYNPMRYCGEYYDVESGLTYLRARYYDPSIGRFINEDPIKDGTNWYVYCSNNPIMFVDPSGLTIKLSDDATKDQKTQYQQAIAYLKTSEEGRKLIERLEESDVEFVIIFSDKDSFDPDTNTIYWNPLGGHILSNHYVQSPALCLAHEMGHGAQNLDGVYDKYADDANGFTWNDRLAYENENIKNYEKPIAEQLGESTRDEYTDTASALCPVPGPTEYGYAIRGEIISSCIENLFGNIRYNWTFRPKVDRGVTR